MLRGSHGPVAHVAVAETCAGQAVARQRRLLCWCAGVYRRRRVHFAVESILTTHLDGLALYRGRDHSNEVSRIRAYTVRSAEREKHHLLRKMLTEYV